MSKRETRRSLLTTHSHNNLKNPDHRAQGWNRHGRVVIPRPGPINSDGESTVTQSIKKVTLLVVDRVLKFTSLAVYRFLPGTSRTTEEIAMFDLHQKSTGTQYTTTVALLALGLSSPVLLIASHPFGYASVSMALASSALCGIFAWLAWKNHSQLTIPSLERPFARSK
jgi:hypothetical protein